MTTPQFQFQGGRFYSLSKLDHVLSDFREPWDWKLGFLAIVYNLAEHRLYLNFNFKGGQLYSLSKLDHVLSDFREPYNEN